MTQKITSLIIGGAFEAVLFGNVIRVEGGSGKIYLVCHGKIYIYLGLGLGSFFGRRCIMSVDSKAKTLHSV